MASELELRTCGRAGCRWPAAASLSFRYETRQVWLIGLAPEPHPALYDLCPHHADALTVPRGWERVDQREPAEAVREPSGHDLVVRARERAGAEPVRVGGGNRYAALAAELPRLAEQYATTVASAAAEPSESSAADLVEKAATEPVEKAATEPVEKAADAPAEMAAAAPSEKVASGQSGAATHKAGGAAASRPSPPPEGFSEGATPVPSRELAPLPVEAAPPRRPRPASAEGGGTDAEGGEAGPDDAPTAEHPGQLAIPVDDVAPEVGAAKVVSIETAGARRRDQPTPRW